MILSSCQGDAVSTKAGNFRVCIQKYGPESLDRAILTGTPAERSLPAMVPQV